MVSRIIAGCVFEVARSAKKSKETDCRSSACWGPKEKLNALWKEKINALWATGRFDTLELDVGVEEKLNG